MASNEYQYWLAIKGQKLKMWIPIKGQASVNEEIYWLLLVKFHCFDHVKYQLKAIRVNN